MGDASAGAGGAVTPPTDAGAAVAARLGALIAKFPTPPTSLPVNKGTARAARGGTSESTRRVEFLKQVLTSPPSSAHLQQLCTLACTSPIDAVYASMTAVLDDIAKRSVMARPRHNRGLLGFVTRKLGSGEDKPDRDVRLDNYVHVLRPPAAPAAPRASFVDAAPCPSHTPISSAMVLSNVGRSKVSVTIRAFASIPEHAANVTIVPEAVVLKRGQSCDVTVTVELLRSGAQVCVPVGVAVAGGSTIYAVIVGRTERSVFGVPVESLPHMDSAGFSVPKPMAVLREFLSQGDRMLSEGIFRLAPDDKEVQRIKASLNNDSFDAKCTPKCAAHLIKLFFRELPVPVLSAVPVESLLRTTSLTDCEVLLELIQGSSRSLLLWLIDLLAEVALHGDHNKMPAKNLGIVVGPNLFNIATDNNVMEALMATQKSVNLLVHLITKDVAAKNKGYAHGVDM